jgi:hypothetical protein
MALQIEGDMTTSFMIERNYQCHWRTNFEVRQVRQALPFRRQLLINWSMTSKLRCKLCVHANIVEKTNC